MGIHVYWYAICMIKCHTLHIYKFRLWQRFIETFNGWVWPASNLILKLSNRITHFQWNAFIKVFTGTGLSQLSSFYWMGVFWAPGGRNVRRGCQCCPTQSSSILCQADTYSNRRPTINALDSRLQTSTVNCWFYVQVCHCISVCSGCWEASWLIWSTLL